MTSAMPINWFPGHMNRARREIAAAVQKVDVVIELVDGRLPHSSRNPLLHQLAQNRPILTILAKADLADPETTRSWQNAWAETSPLALTMGDHKGVRAVLERCRALAPNRGGPGRTLRTLVVGIPNVGKSTLINTLTGRRIAKVGDRPAITRQAKRFELDSDLSIFDSPGVLWPKLDDQQGAKRLAASGAIGTAAFESVDVAGWSVCFLAERYAAEFVARFGLEDEFDDVMHSTSDDAEDASRAVALLEAVGRKRGALRAGGHVDLDRAADLLLRELRGGKIGAISFERPDDHPGYRESQDGRDDREGRLEPSSSSSNST
jgi:ribosome biogenesis GTPase A